jgi:polysaccharide export outer membrane protein
MGMRKFVIAALAATLLSSCAGPTNLPPLEGTRTTAESYRLDSGDQVRITVYNEDQLTGDYAVGADGTISMPLVGAVAARDLTTGELEKSLTKRLSEDAKVLVNPSVSVQLVVARPFYILGEVKNPGQYPCAYETTVLSAVAIAGGFTYRARTDYVSITRKVGEQVVERRADRDSPIQPGDVVYVYERYF